MSRFDRLPKNVADTANPRRYWECPALVSTGHLPDTSTTHSPRGFQPMVSGCPALLRFPHVHTRTRTRSASKTPGHRWIPDTTSNGAGSRCPAGVRLSFVPDTTSKHGETTMSKPMRTLMPEITAFVDALRERGMTDNATLAKGLKEGTFWARENGQAIGSPTPSTETAVQPVTSLGAESRLLDLQWKREQEGRNV